MRVCAVGKFDALHRGHRLLAERAAALGEPALLGFSGLAEALGWGPRLPLTAPGDRARILATWPGAPAELVLPFAAVRGLDPAAFLRLVRAELGAGGLVVGENFRGGPGRAHDAAAFAAAGAALGMPVTVVGHLRDGTGAVSSTRVRAALGSGDVAAAAALLGRPHRLCGRVVTGERRGRTIGFPTANLGERANLAPASGVYAAWAVLDGVRLPAAVNLGVLPTVGADRAPTVEAHLIGWSGDCYGAPLALDFVARLRDERRFPSLAALTAQLAVDVQAASAVLAAG